ncbi:hypothetical protein JCM12141A_00650 [Mycolicibacterium hodleri]
MTDIVLTVRGDLTTTGETVTQQVQRMHSEMTRQRRHIAGEGFGVTASPVQENEVRTFPCLNCPGTDAVDIYEACFRSKQAHTN